MPSVAFHTLGCKLNFAETSTIAKDMVEGGFERVEFQDPADVYIINTCSVTEQVLMMYTSAGSWNSTRSKPPSTMSLAMVEVSAKFSLQPRVWNATVGIK